MRRTLLPSEEPTPIGIPPEVAAPPTTEATLVGRFRWLTIEGHGGTRLAANVIEPTGPGPHPAIVFVNSWGLDDGEYLAQAAKLARKGYVALSYTTRGFWTSGGRIDVAGPLDIADARAAVDWLLAQTSADPARIGMAGISYGSGISVLSAAHDPRVRAVVALSTWADLATALLPYETWSRQAIALLEVFGGLTGRPGSDLQAVLEAYHDNDRDGAKGLVASRSPGSHLDALNANAPAILFANGWSDSLFPAGQLVEFFDRLHMPKRLELVPGDHVIPELTGLAGLPNETWTSVHRWFDHHLHGGSGDGIGGEPPVWVRPTLGGSWQAYHGWTALSSTTRTLHLGRPGRVLGGGQLSDQQAVAWTHRLAAGLDTVASAGVALLTGGAEALGIPQLAWLPAVRTRLAGVWSTPALPRTLAIRGAVRLRVTAEPSTSRATLIAYLYDVDWTGTGRLLTHQPYTVLGAVPGRPLPVDVVLDPVVHDVRPGHRLALVVDTVDPLYRGESRIGSAVTLASSAAEPARLDVPLA